MLLNDHEILARCRKGMITPYSSGQVRAGVISYGVSSYGYDIRLGTKYKIFTNVKNTVVDPKNLSDEAFVDIETVEHGFVTIPPNSFALAESREEIIMPRDVLGICVGKSTYARCGIVVNVTPLEPQWEGKITIEISNTSSCPAKVYSSEGIMQLLFLKAWEVCGMSYKDKKGIYQGQKGITLPIVET
jgi:dCTP deaminase